MRRCPRPARCDVHVGTQDTQSDPDAVAALCRRLGFGFYAVHGGGHRLDEGYVAGVLDGFLAG
ncbi:MAG: hypothetical protein FJ137_21335 [Deltaproteobacteria bacterium]|nr:hypothetical protein [Deltaproteobacteria bacterium]